MKFYLWTLKVINGAWMFYVLKDAHIVFQFVCVVGFMLLIDEVLKLRKL